MSSFKLFFEGDDSEETNIINLILKIKAITEAPPLDYVWIHSAEALNTGLRQIFADEKHVTHPIELARARTPSHGLARSVHKINLQFNTKQNAGIHGQYTLIVEHPISVLVQTIRSEQYKFMHKFYNNINDLQLLLRVDEDETFFYLSEFLIERRIKEQFENIRQHFTAVRKLAQTRSYDINALLETFEELGMAKAEIIRFKMKFGLPVSPNEIDDKTLVDLL